MNFFTSSRRHSNPISSPRRLPRAGVVLASALAASLGTPALLRAATADWSPVPVDAFWSNPLNWGTPPAPADALTFAFSTLTSLTNDLAPATLTNLSFQPGAPSYTLAGNSLTLSGVLANNSTSSQLLSLPLLLTNGASINAGLAPITLAGASAASGTLTFTGGTTRITGAFDGPPGSVIHVGDASVIPTTLLIDGGTLASRSILPFGQWPVSAFKIGAAPGTVTALRMNGGVLSTSGEFWLGEESTSSAYAALTQTAGSITSGSWFVLGHRGDLAVFNQSGGEFRAASFTFSAGINTPTPGNATAVVNLSGGTTTLGFGHVGETGNAALNIWDNASVISSQMTIGGSFSTPNRPIASVNLRGGTLSVGSLMGGSNPGTYHFNFHGGTLRTTGTLLATGSLRTYVYPGGAVIDDTGRAVTFGANLLAPTGNGLASIAVSGGSGYFDMPLVQITRAPGDTTGTGAAAVANLDAAGNLTGITITNPGIDYTLPPIVTILGGGGSGASVSAVSLAPNASGGLTKLGSGTLTLSSTFYTGPTHITAGTLRVTGTLGTTSLVNVLGGAALGGTGHISSPVVLAAGHTPAQQGTLSLLNDAASTLTLSGPLTIGGSGAGDASVVAFDVGTLSHQADRLILGSGPLTINPGGLLVRLNNHGVVPGDVFTLVSHSLSEIPSGITLHPDSLKLGLNTASLSFSSNAITLTISGPASPAIAWWTGAHGNAWNAAGGPQADQANFTLTQGGANTLQYPGPNTDVFFGPGAANLNTTLGQHLEINSLSITAGTAPVTVGGTHSLTIKSGLINVEAGSGGLTLDAALLLPQSTPQVHTWINYAITPLTVGNVSSTSGQRLLSVSGDLRALGNLSLGGGTLDFLAGSLYVGDGGTRGTLSSLTLINRGTLILDRSDNFSISATITGPGSVEQRGIGSTSLSAASSYSGGTLITAGTIRLGSATAAGTGPIANFSALQFETSGAATVANDISGNGRLTLSSSGNSALNLTGNHDYSGPTTITNATATIIYAGTNSHAIGVVTGAGRLQVGNQSPPFATLTSDGVTTGAWLINNTHFIRPNGGATGMSKTSSLTLLYDAGKNWTARLDLADNALALQTTDAADKAAKLATLKSQLATGKAGNHVGFGITSATVAANPQSLTLALADNATLGYTSFRGQTVNANTLLIVPTTFGDATLDGNVDAFDLNLLANNWQKPANALWSDGDFSGDGMVDAFDLNLLAAHWQSGTPALSFLTQDSGPSTQDFPPPSPIPEPASLALLLAGALAALPRRSRSRSCPQFNSAFVPPLLPSPPRKPLLSNSPMQ